MPEHAIAVDDGVRAELVNFVGRPPKPATRQNQSRIHPDRARGPHLAVGASVGTEQSVERPVGLTNVSFQ